MKKVQVFGLLIMVGALSTLRAGTLTQTSQLTSTQQKLLADDGQAGDQLGQSVAVFQDVLVLGAPLDSDNGAASGSAYMFLRNVDTWDEDAKLLASDGAMSDFFGWSVAFADDTAMIGAIFGSDTVGDTGSAYAFVEDGNDWDEQDELVAGDGAALDQFGYSVAIDGDIALVGAILGNDNRDQTGAAYAFGRSGSRWSEKDKLFPSDGDSADYFGWSVALAGDWAVIGAPLHDDQGTSSGAAYAFKRSGTRWSQKDKLLTSDGAASDAFGTSVAIAGDTAVVGAPSILGAGGPPGAAYVFVRDGDDWTESTKLEPSDGESGDFFGTSVSISGELIVVGSPEADGSATASGSAYIFVLSNDEWIEREELVPLPGATDLLFGQSVSISGNTVLVGAPGADDKGMDSGAAFAFELDHHFTLTVTLDGTGTGSVSSSPAGIECEPDCTKDYTVETEVTLTPTPDGDSVFAGWSGGADCADGFVTMDADTTCTATFDLNVHLLTVTKIGDGAGTVTSNPTGIDCGQDCEEPYPPGTSVMLEPTPIGGDLFRGWSGDPDCEDGQVTMTAPMTCIARFEPPEIFEDGFETGNWSNWSIAVP